MHDAIQSRNKKRQLEKMCNVLLCMIGRSCSLYISQNSKTPEVRSRAAQRHSPYRASAADTWADKDAVDRLFAVLRDVGIRFAPPAKMGYRHTCIRIIFSPPILKVHMSADAYSIVCCIFTFFSSRVQNLQMQIAGRVRYPARNVSGKKVLLEQTPPAPPRSTKTPKVQEKGKVWACAERSCE